MASPMTAKTRNSRHHCGPFDDREAESIHLSTVSTKKEEKEQKKKERTAAITLNFPHPCVDETQQFNADQAVAALSTSDWPLFVGLGVLGAGLSFVFYIIGLNHTAPAVASIVAMVEPVTASLFGVVVLSETLVGSQILGMGLILVTVTTLSVFSSSGRPPSDLTVV